jgi:protein-S-isoprenylcysteine O-methyltransferase Ste14
MAMFHGPLIGAIWAVWLIYWYVAALDAKPNLRRETGNSRRTHGIPLVIAILLIAYPRRGPDPGWFFATILPRGIAVYWIGIALLVLGLGFSIWARRRLGRNWSGTVTVKENHELIRTGPYRWVRHPIYTGMLLGFAGSAVALDEWRGIAAVLLVILAFQLKIRIEEEWMTETFGDGYRRYRAEVRALIPFVL